jgi:hypothetical protein
MKKNIIFMVLAGALIACMTVGGCRSASPPVAFYTLTSLEATQMKDNDQDVLKNISVGVGPIQFPEVLDRPQIVTRRSPNRIELSEFNRWGGNLNQNFLDVLTQNISIYTGSDQIFRYPVLNNLEPAYRVVLDVHQFDGRPGETVVLNVSWAVIASGNNPANNMMKRSFIKQPVAGDDYDALVKAQSEAIKTLSQAIADEIKYKVK